MTGIVLHLRTWLQSLVPYTPAMTKRLILLLILFAVLPGAAAAETLTGRVVAIADGDTLTLLDASLHQHRIRLTGIDAPEKAQPFGQRSKQNLSSLAFGKSVVAECPKHDRYGRQLCKVRVAGQDVNLAQVKAGLAWHYKQYDREQTAQDRAAYALAEREARAAYSGLWSDPRPVPPWEWRRRRH